MIGRIFGSLFLMIVQGSSTATTDGTVFLVDSDIGQPPSTLANSSKSQSSCFSKFPSVALNSRPFDVVPGSLSSF